jgi:long-chain acyl-CoA synthetase
LRYATIEVVTANLADLVAESAQRRPGHVAIVDGERRTTYAGLDSAIDCFAAGLARAGVQPGDRVALLLANRTEFAVAYFGTLRRGAVAVPLNIGSTPDELAHVVAEVEPVAVFAEVALRPVLQGVLPESTPMMLVGSSQWTNLIADGRKAPLEPAETSPEDVAVLLFTAGTTGRPKAAMLTHRALADNVQELRDLTDPPAVTTDDLVLGVLPLFHVYSLNSVLALTLAAGATLVLQPRFVPRQTLELVQSAGITVIGGAPPMYIAWSAEPDLREMLAGVRLMTSGSSPLPPAVFEQYATTAGKPIWEGYGLTECSPVVANTLVSGRPKAGSVGRPLPGVEVMLVDQGGDPAEDGTGEIYIRGASLFSGYWPDGRGGPDNNGWFATGDVAVLDDDGDLRLVDRTQELILVSGFNVYPREVERAIQELPGVAEVAVIGVPHPYAGEAVKAFVAPMPGREIEAATVVAHCEERLARFKCPTIVEVLDELPHSSIGKIARGTLRELSGA